MHPRQWLAWFRGRGTRLRWLILAAIGLGVIVVAGLVLRGWWKSRQVEAELARIRAAGEPVTYADLARLYNSDPADDDATQLWLDAFAAERPYNSVLGNDLPIIGFGRDLPAPGVEWAQLEEVEKYLAYQGEFLDRVRAAAAHGGRVRFPIQFELSWQVQLLDYVNPLRSATRLLALESHARAHRGDAQGAADSLRASFACARVLRDVPDSSGILIRAGLDDISLTTLNDLWTVVDFSDGDLAAFQDALRHPQYKESLYSAVLAQRVGGISMLKDLGSVGFFQSFGQKELWLRGDFESYLGKMRLSVERTRKPWPEALKGLSFDDVGLSERSVGGVSVDVWSESLASYGNTSILAAGRYAARFHCAEAAVAVWRYRRRHGDLPESLAELVPELLAEVPSDPFDGAAVRYVVSDDDFAVYCVGEDGIDDGGKSGGAKGRDVVFRVRLNRSGVGRP